MAVIVGVFCVCMFGGGTQSYYVFIQGATDGVGIGPAEVSAERHMRVYRRGRQLYMPLRNLLYGNFVFQHFREMCTVTKIPLFPLYKPTTKILRCLRFQQLMTSIVSKAR